MLCWTCFIRVFWEADVPVRVYRLRSDLRRTGGRSVSDLRGEVYRLAGENGFLRGSS